MTKSLKALKVQMSLMETYLLEFCKVREIQESELKKYLTVLSCASDNSVMAINVDDQRDVKFGVRVNTFGVLEIFGEFLDEKEFFPKTVKLLNENGGIAGDTILTSGE